MRMLFIGCVVLTMACATTPSAPPETMTQTQRDDEPHLVDVVAITTSGENAEAYWNFQGTSLSLQARKPDEGCDRIYTVEVVDKTGALLPKPQMNLLSSGQGATTCSHFMPSGKDVIYASTHLGGAACPPKPDMKLGYVWALYDSYDIFKSSLDGKTVTRLTETPGYDAEATVCGKDGSIIFTSVRDGDIELYRMDADGKNVKRLTFTPGYDGGAFFNKDCSKIVWRASRPTEGKDLDDYKSLLAQGLVRPSKLELFVANADGSDAHQVTYLNSASFAPFWFPNKERLLFSSNYGDPKGREFDIWAINADGTNLERITSSPSFDGFPMFSPDGKYLAFSSNRITAPGKSDTNLFIARWVDSPPAQTSLVTASADRVAAEIRWLADPAREGRGLGTKGLEETTAHLEARMTELGLEPIGGTGTYRMPFEVTTAVERGPQTKLRIAGKDVASELFMPMGWSGQAAAKGALVLAGYGLVEPELGIDDYKGVDAKGKIVVVRRFVPEHEKLTSAEQQRRLGDLRKKAFVAKSKGAVGLIVVDWPVLPPSTKEKPNDGKLPPEAPLPALLPEGTTGDASIPVMAVKRQALEPLFAQLEKKKGSPAELQVALTFTKSTTFNLVGRVKAPNASEGSIIIGAHYDHLGLGGPNSLAPDKHEPHVGADDNASGVAGVLEIARLVTEKKNELKRDVIVTFFSAEESGVLGSSAMVQAAPAWMKSAHAMLNLDMVGRLRGNLLTVLGSESATEWKALVETACKTERVQCSASGDGYGPSDHMSFFTAGIPVLHFFTGAHSEYHKPADRPETINAAGVAQIARVVTDVAVSSSASVLSFQKATQSHAKGDARSFNASLGTVPNYGGPPPGKKGVLLDDVRPGGGAEKAGLKRGDIITKLGRFDVASVEDLMFVLMQAKPGETVTAVVDRDGAPVSVDVTFQEGRRR